MATKYLPLKDKSWLFHADKKEVATILFTHFFINQHSMKKNFTKLLLFGILKSKDIFIMKFFCEEGAMNGMSVKNDVLFFI